MATTTTTTTATMPRATQRSSFTHAASSNPPTSALPALPGSLATKPSLANLRRGGSSAVGRSLSGTYGRPPSAQPIPRSVSASSPSPSLSSSSAAPSSSGELPKRAVSLATCFPQPPRSGGLGRVASLPPPTFPPPGSPLASPTRPAGARDSYRPRPARSSGSLSAKLSRDSMRDSGVGLLYSAADYTHGAPPPTNHARTYSATDCTRSPPPADHAHTHPARNSHTLTPPTTTTTTTTATATTATATTSPSCSSRSGSALEHYPVHPTPPIPSHFAAAAAANPPSYTTSPYTPHAPYTADEPRGRSDERDSSPSDKETKGNVLVSVRVRPDGPDDTMNADWTVDAARGQLGYGGKDGGSFDFDHVFAPAAGNGRVYEACAKRLVRRVMEGYHGTVFAYGMTGTGKTYSMQGTAASPGVIPLAVTDIFAFIRETPHREFLLRVSYLEIYNERIHDLLAATPGTAGFVPLDQQLKGDDIKLREDPKRGVYATPLREEIVQSPTQLLRVIARGDLCRRTGSTQFNARSSRSHAVVQIVVESRARVGGGGSSGAPAAGAPPAVAGAASASGVRVSTLALIDLAGSERAAETKERRTEGSHINRSLLTLGTVIARLAKDDRAADRDRDGSHLPYRDSKLTRLLQPALSGNSLISILCTIAVPLANAGGATALTHVGETMSTLKFAARARNNIVSHARRGDDLLPGAGGDAGSRALLERYRAEIGELRRALEQQQHQHQLQLQHQSQGQSHSNPRRRGSDAEVDAATAAAAAATATAAAAAAAAAAARDRHSEQMLEMQLARTALKERIEHLNRLILCSQSSGVNSARSSTAGPPLAASASTAVRLSTASTTSSSTSTSTNTASSSSTATAADDDSAGGEFNDGNASLAVQVRALQADLADKTRYIATLEKRLLQARRSSQSRASISIGGSSSRSSSSGSGGRGSGGGGASGGGRAVDMLLQEKDAEIAELRARLDDKERMVVALRSAARKRDVADVCVAKRRSSSARLSLRANTGALADCF